jgi:hypothetical protein
LCGLGGWFVCVGVGLLAGLWFVFVVGLCVLGVDVCLLLLFCLCMVFVSLVCVVVVWCVCGCLGVWLVCCLIVVIFG